MTYRREIWDDLIEDIENDESKLFKTIELNWSRPQKISNTRLSPKCVPEFEDNNPRIYILTRNHHKSNEKNKIVYVGISRTPKSRFFNHPTFERWADKKSGIDISNATINVSKYISRSIVDESQRAKATTELLQQIEHLLIWILQYRFELDNISNTLSLPKLRSPSNKIDKKFGWHIKNSGFRFSGRLPREILFPWIVTKIGRNRSSKTL